MSHLDQDSMVEYYKEKDQQSIVELIEYLFTEDGLKIGCIVSTTVGTNLQEMSQIDNDKKEEYILNLGAFQMGAKFGPEGPLDTLNVFVERGEEVDQELLLTALKYLNLFCKDVLNFAKGGPTETDQSLVHILSCTFYTNAGIIVMD